MSASLRDIYLAKKISGLYWFLLIVLTTSTIFFFLLTFKLIPIPDQQVFSVSSEIVGGLFFGVGAALASGCVTTSLIKLGDGRVTGLVSIFGFVLFALATNQGPLSPLNNFMQQNIVVTDNFRASLNFNPLLIVAPLLVILVVFIWHEQKGKKTVYPVPASNQKPLLRKKLNPFVTAGILGLVAGFGFYFSYQTGRYGSVATLGPLLSWQIFFSSFPHHFDWGEMFVAGLVLGSLLFTVLNGEFSFKDYTGNDLMKSFSGGALMGFGAVMGKGCILANGIVGSAMLSAESLLNIVFITFGLWLGSYVIYVRPQNKEKKL
ncbi:membrane protein [Xylocopilactobacillus apicola]|uniref:Membrane protein n=1 Tax=Xylocopilactobacillus apicola TaxID=2932184 RepID=A0AAU9D702_9LACO|nr:membrane protein [Xylocopilactobacillus apicola]